jgi:Icc-related predicted phosphoesterase
MKFSLASDVHLECGYLDLTNEEGSDVLVLAGDIFVANEFRIKTGNGHTYRRFIEEVTGRYGHVVYIMGNHEHYHGDYAKTADIIRDEFKYFNNLKFLDNTFVDICDVRFIGGTLWTDLNKNDPLTIQQIQRSMNDYRLVENSGNPVSYRVTNTDGQVSFKTRPSRLHPNDCAEEHKKCLATISEILNSYQDDKKVVVVTHHLPTLESVPHEYRRDYHGNGAFASDLSNFILDRPRIKYWIHGHTHDPCDYMVGDTRVVCNPRGYIGYETIARNFKIKQYEV